MSARTPEAEPLLTPAEVATMFRVDPKTVTRWRVAGPRRAARRRAARSPAREAHPRSSRPGLGPDPLAGDRGRNVRARPVVPNSDIRATLP